jgi:hypothetical protein
MNLINILEMLIDWKAAGERHGGCIYRSIHINATQRFNYGPELTTILANTAKHLKYPKQPTKPTTIVINYTHAQPEQYTINDNNTITIHHPTTPYTIALQFKHINHTTTAKTNTNPTHNYNPDLPTILQLP